MTPPPSRDSIASAQSQASVFRLLTWKATIPIEIQLARESLPPGHLQESTVRHGVEGNQRSEDDDGDDEEDELPRYYMQVPRYTYLPLLLPEIEEIFISSIIPSPSPSASADREGSGSSMTSGQMSQSGMKPKRTRDEWWFEVEWQGRNGKQRDVCKWHWSVDMIQLHTIINSYPGSSSHHHHHQPTRHTASASTTTNPTSPLRLILHLKPRHSPSAAASSHTPTSTTTSTPPPPVSAPQPALSNSIETCRIGFISLLKEADYIRWGNTRRITGLRRADLEGAWEGVVDHNYETHARFTQKIVPLPLPAPTRPPSHTSHTKGKGTTTSTTTAAAAATLSQPPPENLGVSSSSPDSCYAVRSVPLKLYLSDNAPEIQDIVSPVTSDGEPTTIIHMLRQTLPLLFPENSHVAVPGAGSDTTESGRTDTCYTLAKPILYGVVLPPEAEVAWLAACVCAPDGWLRIGIQLA